jgi:hypothetical protein
MTKRLTLSALVIAALILHTANLQAQMFPVPDLSPPVPTAEGDEATDEAAESVEDTDAAATPDPAASEAPLDPRFIRLRLQDGSVISGNLSVAEIEMDTDFGKLTVPIDRIRSFSPGLDSYPELAAEIDKMIEDLGADDYKLREETQKELLKMGRKIRRELEKYKRDENAERQRRVQQIIEALDERAMEHEAFDEEQAEPWIREDTLVTTEFTAVGKILPKTFEIESKYGSLTVELADVQVGERGSRRAAPVHRKLNVTGMNLVQTNLKSSGVQIRKGDKVTVRADGQIVMSPWGSNSICGPDGGSNFGWYVANEIPGGALVARIGSSGKVFKVGSSHSFVAKSSGTLYFAIAMQHQYANQGYNYPGQYNVRIKVQPQ